MATAAPWSARCAKVGGDGRGIRRQGDVAVLGAPGDPGTPRRAVLRAGCSSCATSLRSARALRDARASNTRRQYRSAWGGWVAWCADHDHQALPADPAAVVAYLAERTEQGAAAATVRTIRAAIGAAHRDAGADDPTAHDGVRRVLQGLCRQAVGRGRGQAQGLTAEDCAAILATASIPRRTGRGVESETAAADRGAVDKAIVSLLFQGGLRRSEAAALRWADVQDATDGRGVLVYVRRSKTDQDGTAADVRYLKKGCAVALRQLRDRITVQRSGLRPDATAPVLRGLNGQSIARRLRSSGQGRRHRGADHRALRARWPRLRAHRPHGRPLQRRAPPPSRAPSPSICRRAAKRSI